MVDGGADDGRNDLLVQLRGDDGRRRVGPHAAGVGPLVAVENPLVVLGRGQGEDVPAVGEGEEGGLLAGHELLDHHLGAGGPEDLVQHDVVDGGHRLLHRHRHHHPLAGGQAVGLDDDGSALLADVGDRPVPIGEGGVGGGGDAVLGHQVLGEGLAPLDPRRRLARPEDLEAGGLEAVDDPQGERDLGADHGQVDLLGQGKVKQRVDLVGGDVHALGQLGDAGVARRAVERLDQGRLGELPDQGVLAAAAADNQNFHNGILSKIRDSQLVIGDWQKPLASHESRSTHHGL